MLITRGELKSTKCDFKNLKAHAFSTEFQPQTLPPSPDSLAIAYRILCAHRDLVRQGSPLVEKGKELLSFYNCGQIAGASQPHQHLQFAELGGEGEVEAAGGNERARCAIPVEGLLDTIVRDGKEEGERISVLYEADG